MGTGKFFQQINYSACNEDSESERKALHLKEDDTVLCITGSGARALDLLIDQPGKIISVDFNPTQNHLLHLKIAACRALDYPAWAAFLGLTDASDRVRTYRTLSRLLPAASKAFWDQNTRLIQAGVLYCGTWEKLLAGMSKAAFFRKNMIQKLLQTESLEAQRIFWNEQWDNGTWKWLLKVICNRFLWTYVVREPGAHLIPSSFSLFDYMYERLHHLGNHHWIRENHFAHLLFTGRYQEGCELPLHLQESNYKRMRAGLDQVEVVTDSLLNVLQDKNRMQSITAFSLSDFSSYAEPDRYAAIWKALAENAPAGARFCTRQFLVKRQPEKLQASIQRNHELEKRLEWEDSTALYSFCAGRL